MNGDTLITVKRRGVTSWCCTRLWYIIGQSSPSPSVPVSLLVNPTCLIILPRWSIFWLCNERVEPSHPNIITGSNYLPLLFPSDLAAPPNLKLEFPQISWILCKRNQMEWKTDLPILLATSAVRLFAATWYHLFSDILKICMAYLFFTAH